MAEMQCPQCGRELILDETTCSGCGYSLNGAMLAATRDATQQPIPPPMPPSGKLPKELLEWARQQLSEEEFLAGLREIQESGGLELKDFIQELEQEASPHD